ncbi:hypothetical protein VKT23_007988 [Stygiomarasmius scandens]|uniref:Uncharacterized protein n=1 Tax=Marasmiellus scandens TaxID=2682957 RepID=A0ABR1JIZ4_9AGAR
MSRSQNNASTRPHGSMTGYPVPVTQHVPTYPRVPVRMPANPDHYHPGASLPQAPFHPQPQPQLRSEAHPPNGHAHAHAHQKSRFPSPPPMNHLTPPLPGSTPVPYFQQQSGQPGFSSKATPEATSNPNVTAPVPRRPAPLSDLNQVARSKNEEDHKRKPTLHPPTQGRNYDSSSSGSGYGSQGTNARGAQALRPETMKPRADMLFGDHPATNGPKWSASTVLSHQPLL